MKRVSIEEIDHNDDYSYTYQGTPFTGVAYERGPAGQLVSEMTFAKGIQEGPARGWYPSGSKLAEENYHQGSLDGAGTEWFEDGKLKQRTLHELGICIESDMWDEQGTLISTYRLTEEDPNHRMLKAFRRMRPSE
jgi:antitoxin component YwqK of YwqJK toxin-antitoxin module